MRTFVIITTLVFLIACSNKKTDEKTLQYYVVGSTGKITKDTSNSTKAERPDSADQLIGQGVFNYYNKDHVVKVYTSDNHAPIDGGRLYYTLDSLGVFFSKSTTWPGFGRLKTNNDSINDLLTQAFVYILNTPNLHCYQCGLVDTTTNTFVPPIIKDE